jgi:hypothetical protein
MKRKWSERSVAISLGIICIILVAGMVEIWLSHLVQDIKKEEPITSSILPLEPYTCSFKKVDPFSSKSAIREHDK